MIKSTKSYQVKIGLPVYNGGNLLKRAIDSLLNQDYHDFQLIISDNASNDNTQETCLDYAKQDNRIIYMRNSENIGLGNNHTKVFELAEGSKYFMWGSNDNIWDKTFMSKTLKALEENPNATLCSPEINFIDLKGNPIDEFNNSSMSKSIDTIGMDIEKKYYELMDRSCWIISYGLYRYNALKKTMPFPNIHSGDIILLFTHLLTGDFIKIPEKLFHYTYRKRSKEDYIEDMSPSKKDNSFNENAFTNANFRIIDNIFNSEIDINLKFKAYKAFINSMKDKFDWLEALDREGTDIETLNKYALQKNSNLINLFKENAYKNVESGQYFLAKEYLSNLMPFISNNLDILYNLALCESHFKNYKKSIEYLSDSLKLGFYNRKLFELMSDCLNKLGDFKTAEIFLKKAKNI